MIIGHSIFTGNIEAAQNVIISGGLSSKGGLTLDPSVKLLWRNDLDTYSTAETNSLISNITGSYATSNSLNATNSNVVNVSSSLNTVISKQNTISGNLDTVIGKQQTISGNLDVVISKQNTISGNLDTVISKQATISANVDSLIFIREKSKEPMGFANRTDSSLNFNPATRTVTFQPTGSSFDVFGNGVRYNKTTPVSASFSNVTGLWFIYLDTTGNIQVSLTPWDLEAVIPAAFVGWDAISGRGIVCDERHGITMDWATHKFLHTTKGPEIVGGELTANSYVIQPSVPVDASNRFGFNSATLYDEDLILSLVAISSGGGNYTIMYRNGTNWNWDLNASFPFKYTATNITYNLSGSQANVSNGYYVNYYVLATNAISGSYQRIMIQGQNQFSTLGAAQAVTFADLSSVSSIPVAEYIVTHKITYGTIISGASAYTNTGKTRIEALVKLFNINSATVLNGLNTHQSQINRDIAGCHPATAISYIPSISSWAVADVGGALDSLNRWPIISGGSNSLLQNDGLGNLSWSNWITNTTQVISGSSNITASRVKYIGSVSNQILMMPNGLYGVDIKIRNAASVAVTLSGYGNNTIEGETSMILNIGDPITLNCIGTDWTVF